MCDTGCKEFARFASSNLGAVGWASLSSKRSLLFSNPSLLSSSYRLQFLSFSSLFFAPIYSFPSFHSLSQLRCSCRSSSQDDLSDSLSPSPCFLLWLTFCILDSSCHAYKQFYQWTFQLIRHTRFTVCSGLHSLVPNSAICKVGKRVRRPERWDVANSRGGQWRRNSNRCREISSICSRHPQTIAHVSSRGRVRCLLHRQFCPPSHPRFYSEYRPVSAVDH